MQVRRFWLLILALAMSVSACRAAPGSVIVDVRNASSEAITLVTKEAGPFLFSRTGTHVIEPWHEGMCFAHLGLENGHIKLTVSGPNITTPATYEATTPDSPTEIGIQVDAGGHVVFGGTFPDDKLPCQGGGY
jgi:hypothetical protein